MILDRGVREVVLVESAVKFKMELVDLHRDATICGNQGLIARD